MALVSVEERTLPKYHRIKRSVESLIQSGELGPGDQVPSENQLARQFHVNRLTASRALHRLVQEGALVREQGRGTFVASRGRTRVHSIAVLVFDVEDPFHAIMAKGTEQMASGKNYHLFLTNTLADPDREKQAVTSLLRQKKVDGFLIWPGDNNLASPIYPMLSRHKIPFVLMLSVNQDKAAAYDYVVGNEEEGAFRAVSQLIHQGHRRIGFLNASAWDKYTASVRLQGYVRAFVENGLAVPHDLVFEAAGIDVHHAAPAAQFYAATGCTAVFCLGYKLGVGLIRALRERNIRVPEDMSVSAFDTMLNFMYPDLELTGVDQPLGEIGRRAAEILVERINGNPSGPIHEKLACNFVERKTTRPIEKRRIP